MAEVPVIGTHTPGIGQHPAGGSHTGSGMVPCPPWALQQWSGMDPIPIPVLGFPQ